MQAVIMRDGRLVVDEVPDLEPGPGQVLVRTLACGICGSDLHTLQHPETWVDMASEAADATPEGMPTAKVMDITRDVVMGHEFCAEVLDVGANTANCRPGDIVVSVPITMDLNGIHPIGYSNLYPGGYAEQMILSDFLAVKVPNGLDPSRAALTEPMAVGAHAVNRAAITPGDTAVVLGCGPVGLAVIAALHLLGVEPVVAADFSSARRRLARHLGADVVVDPREEPAMDAWRRADGKRRVVIFEAVGAAGMLDQAIRMAPRHTQILVVGVCMAPDTIQPMRAVTKELNLSFSFGYDPIEFKDTLDRIADGQIDVAPLITATVPLAGVAGAFADLADPEQHAKILVQPS